jgi:putative copper export protein
VTVVAIVGQTVSQAVGQATDNVPSLSDGLGGFRLILHVLAATVWVGGQFTVAGLLPTIRTLGEDAPKTVARAFGRLLWPAYAVLVVTGFWNISALTVKDASSAWKAVLIVKIAVVVVAGVAVFLHQRATSKRATAAWGAIGALASVAALCLGVFLAG